MAKKDYSCGIIPLQMRGRQWWVLLVRHRQGAHWSFPKGHQEGEESPWETAQRELLEETGLSSVQRLFDYPLREHYHIAARNIDKTIDYFVAEVAGELVLQAIEISDGCWLPLEQAVQLLTFPEGRALHGQLTALLSSL